MGVQRNRPGGIAMKKLLVTVCFGLALIQLNAQSTAIPRYKISDLVKLIDTSRTPLVINFWASWCGPCVREIPWFEKSVAAYRDKGVQLLLVSLDFADDYPKGIAQFAQKNGYLSRIAWLDETDAEQFCPKIDSSWDGVIPATLFVNKKLQYRKFFGRQLTEAQLLQELQSLVGL